MPTARRRRLSHVASQLSEPTTMSRCLHDVRPKTMPAMGIIPRTSEEMPNLQVNVSTEAGQEVEEGVRSVRALALLDKRISLFLAKTFELEVARMCGGAGSCAVVCEEEDGADHRQGVAINSRNELHLPHASRVHRSLQRQTDNVPDERLLGQTFERLAECRTELLCSTRLLLEPSAFHHERVMTLLQQDRIKQFVLDITEERPREHQDGNAAFGQNKQQGSYRREWTEEEEEGGLNRQSEE